MAVEEVTPQLKQRINEMAKESNEGRMSQEFETTPSFLLSYVVIVLRLLCLRVLHYRQQDSLNVSPNVFCFQTVIVVVIINNAFKTSFIPMI